MKETEQTLFDQIKDGVAVENGSEDWHAYDKKIRYTPLYSLVWKQVCERYATAKAKASCEATLKKASENVKIKNTDPYTKRFYTTVDNIDIQRLERGVLSIDKSSITDPSNIVIVP